MFKKWGQPDEKPSFELNTDFMKDVHKGQTEYQKTNTILRGSRLIGDINVTCDLELGGEIKGNIRSEKDSNIVIKGICNGNVETVEGSVTIEGELHGGNITAGKDVTISGKFTGGEIKAQNRIQINGEFNGKLIADDIEIGPHARGKGELLYRENIAVAKGAKIEAHISQTQKELKLVKPASSEKPKAIKLAVQDICEI